MSEPLTEEQTERYLAASHRCPYCQSENIEGDASFDFSGDDIRKNIECLDCGKQWIDTYSLSGVEAAEEDV
jgi:predicted Zn-ribbon and HTH transcriptional regulator